MNEKLSVSIDPAKLKNIKCSGCQGEIFDQVAELKEVPGVISANALPTTMLIPHFRCVSCGKILKQGNINNDKKN